MPDWTLSCGLELLCCELSWSCSPPPPSSPPYLSVCPSVVLALDHIWHTQTYCRTVLCSLGCNNRIIYSSVKALENLVETDN